MSRTRQLARAAADGAVIGAVVGLSFAYLELAVGCGVAGAFPAVEGRLPAPDVALLVTLADAGLGALLGMLAQVCCRCIGVRFERLATAAAVAGALAGIELEVFLLAKSRTLFTIWWSWRRAILPVGMGVGLLQAFALVWGALRFTPAAWRERAFFSAAVLALPAYLVAWIPLAAVELLRDASLLESLRPWLLAPLPYVLLAAAPLSRRPFVHRASGLGAVAAGLAVIALPLGRSGMPPALAASPAQPDAASPPIILIVADTLRADHLPTYGYLRNTAPRLDELALAATVFERCITPSPWTMPAHASLITGLFPRSHGVHLTPDRSPTRLRLPLQLHTLPEALDAAGYRTLAAVANPWLRAESGFSQGFDAYYDAQRRLPTVIPLAIALSSLLAGRPWAPAWLDPLDQRLSRAVTPYLSFSELAAVADAWLGESEAHPFFLFVNAMEPHDPFHPPEPFGSAWPGRIDREVPFHHVRSRVMREAWAPGDSILHHFISQYDGEISYLDSQLGAFLDRLRERGLFEKSWIIVTSDHGEHFGEHGLLWHRVSVYQPLLHVPLIVKRPGQNDGERIPGPVQLVDLMPTLLDAVGAELPERIQGTGLWDGRDEVFAELYRDRWIVDAHGGRFDRDLFAYQRGRWKLIRSSEGARELYDLAAGDAEGSDLSTRAGPGLHSLERQMDRFLAELPPPAVREDKAIGADLHRRLRSLGYAE